MKSPLISIIIPAYNAGKYLRRCVDSILNQTFNDFELFIINDGSTDGTKEICDEYLLIDHRIKIIHKENGGVSSARNRGLDNAKGEWVVFVDADDYIPQNALENMVAQSKTTDCECLYFGILHECGGIWKKMSCRLTPMTYKPEEIISALLEHTPLVGPVAKLVKRSLFENLRFNENLQIGEDLLLNIQIALKVKQIKICDETVYYYADNPNSAMHGKEMFSKDIALIDCVKNYFSEKNISERYNEELKYFELWNLSNSFICEPKQIITNYSLARKLKVLSKECSISSPRLKWRGIRLVINYPLVYFVYSIIKKMLKK